ncbi:MAG: DUF3387 domain-containing protein, partial [Chloroflexi bacterium]|nr:DUF3387 domain-containing protein [Chloroflexota bacterium]
NFAHAGVVTEPEQAVRAQSGEHLQQLLQEDHRYVFSLIHKFRSEPGRPYPVLSLRDDIIVITDEAHRTQYDLLAQNMRTALPNAAFIGFTGTPLMAGEEKTRQVFGDYVSVYNFRQSIEDQATVPLYYENRIPELQLTNQELNEEMEQLLEAAEIDEAQERKLEREFAREYHLITRDDRLEKIAEDVVQHFLGRGFQGKAMVVSVDKVTAGRMVQKVRAHWQRQLAIAQAELETTEDDYERLWLQEMVRTMQETDMALVISESQGEVAEFRRKGLDILPHRLRLKREDLDEKFKDPADPLRLVFVCAMWMTGFDVPSCSTIYLDKPMRNHTLMQTIARANRVFADKHSGLIVDYVGVFRDLQRALAIYGSSAGGGVREGDRPIAPKAALLAELRQAAAEATAFCLQLGIDLEAIEAAGGFERIRLIEDARDAILVNDPTRLRYLELAGTVDHLFQAVLPAPQANELIGLRNVLTVMARKIRAEEPEAGISGVMGQVDALLDRSVAAEAYVIHEPPATLNLGDIDFDALQAHFRSGRKNITANKLRGDVYRRLSVLVRLNNARLDYLERLQQMIDDYNAGRDNVDVFFEKLLALARELNEEERRAVAENLSEEELALFDILLKPRPELTRAEIQQVKDAARELLDTLRAEKLVLDWRKRQQTRAAVQLAIEELLDTRLPAAYDSDLYRQKCDQVYDRVYEKYYGAGQSVYTTLN